VQNCGVRPGNPLEREPIEFSFVPFPRWFHLDSGPASGRRKEKLSHLGTLRELHGWPGRPAWWPDA